MDTDSTGGPGATKTWGLMALLKGKTPAVDKELANTVPAYPNAPRAVQASRDVLVAAWRCATRPASPRAVPKRFLTPSPCYADPHKMP